MGWKTRNGRSYYYQSERSGSSVKSRYIGTGEQADLFSQLVKIDAEKRQFESVWKRERNERIERFSARIAKACRLLTVAAESIAHAAGYHRHHRGPWRRRRNMSTETPLATTFRTDSIASLARRYEAGETQALEEVDSIIHEADQGNQTAAREVAKLMTASSSIADRFRTNMATIAEERLIGHIFGKKKLATAEGIRRKLAEVRSGLEGPNPSVIEKLLAERAALCWLDLYFIECVEAEPSSRSIVQADYAARQRDRSHRRYLSSLKALAAVRKIPVVAVQVNVGTDAQDGSRA